MTTREKVMALVDQMSESQLEAAYPRLQDAAKSPMSDAEFQQLQARISEFRKGLGDVPDATQLIRDEREWHATRVL